jgi:predicted Zn-dependent protease with MMP-like domain
MKYEALTESEWEEVDQVWDLIEDGRIEQARARLATLLRQRPAHPDLKIVEASLALEEEEPRRALRALRGAESSADPAVYFHLRGLAHYGLAEFEEARRDAEQAVTIRPDLAEGHDLLSRACDHLGQPERAAEHAEDAHVLDPEGFPEPLEVSDEEFDAIVEKAVAELPEPVRRQLEQVPVVVEPLPGREVLVDQDPPLDPDLLGLFVGRHLLERSSQDSPAPGVIYLFRRNLLRACGSREELAKEIRITVQHEVGHLLGLDEDDLDRWGLA